MEWAYELVNGYKAGDARTKRPRREHAHDRRPDRQPRRLQHLARGRRAEGGGDGRGTPNPGEDDETVNIVAHPNEYRRKNCRFADDSEGGIVRAAGARPRRAGRRPEPQLRRLLGRPGREHRPDQRDLPRRRPVLRAGDAEHPRRWSRAPGDDADHQPHVLGPRAAPAGHRRSRARRRTRPIYKALGDAMADRERLHEPALATSSTTRPARPRTGATTPPAASASRSRSAACDRRPRDRRVPDRALPPAVRRDGQGVRRRDGVRQTRAAATATATARPTTRRRRTPPTRPSTPCSRAARPPGAILRLNKDVRHADLAEQRRTSRSGRSRTSSTRRMQVPPTRASSSGTSTSRRGRSSSRTSGRARDRPAEPAADLQRRRRAAAAPTAPRRRRREPTDDAADFNEHPFTVPAGGRQRRAPRSARSGRRRRPTGT